MKSSKKRILGLLRPRTPSLLLFFAMLLLIPMQARAEEPQTLGETCYAISDEYKVDGEESHADWLMALDLQASPATLTKVGPTFTLNAESLAFGPDGTLYTVNKYFGVLNASTGAFTQIGTERLHDVDSLTYDPFTRSMFATERHTDGKADQLIEVDIATGHKASDGVDVAVEIITDNTNGNLRYLHDVDALAIEPTTGDLYGVLNDNGSGGVLAIINKSDGTVTRIANLMQWNQESAEYEQIEDIEGLTFGIIDGETWTLYATAGDNLDPHPNPNCLITIDTDTGIVNTLLKELHVPNIIDIEGLACRYEPVEQCNPGIDIEQLTNGQDVDEAPGIYVRVGKPMHWEFIVTNTGNVPLQDVQVHDYKLGEICVIPELAPGEIQTCEKTGIAEEGGFSNMTVATGLPMCAETEERVSAEDNCNYFGYRPEVDLDKSCNEREVEAPIGPWIRPDGVAKWTFIVTNKGNIALKDLMVTDDPRGPICEIPSLDINESAVCTDEVTVFEPQAFENLGTVIGYADGGRFVLDRADARVEDSDTSICEVEVTQPNVELRKESSFDWRYRITNIGTVPLNSVGCEMPPDVELMPLEPAASWILEPGNYWETAGICEFGDCAGAFEMHAIAVNGTTKAMDTMSAMEMLDGLDVNVTVNGLQTTVPEDLLAPEGEAVIWRYEVSNHTGTELTDIKVQHAAMDSTNGYTEVSCPQDSLLPNGSTTCSFTASAEVGQHSAIGYVSGKGMVAYGEHGGPEKQEIAASAISHYKGTSQKPATVKGRVFRDMYVNGSGSANGICDPDEPGVSGIGVEIYPDASHTEIASTVTDATGSYALEVPAGTYWLRFVQPGADPTQWMPWSRSEQSENELLDSDVTLGAGANLAFTEAFTLISGDVVAGWDAGLVAEFFANEYYLPLMLH